MYQLKSMQGQVNEKEKNLYFRVVHSVIDPAHLTHSHILALCNWLLETSSAISTVPRKLHFSPSVTPLGVPLHQVECSEFVVLFCFFPID